MRNQVELFEEAPDGGQRQQGTEAEQRGPDIAVAKIFVRFLGDQPAIAQTIIRTPIDGAEANRKAAAPLGLTCHAPRSP